MLLFYIHNYVTKFVIVVIQFNYTFFSYCYMYLRVQQKQKQKPNFYLYIVARFTDMSNFGVFFVNNLFKIINFYKM